MREVTLFDFSFHYVAITRYPCGILCLDIRVLCSVCDGRQHGRPVVGPDIDRIVVDINRCDKCDKFATVSLNWYCPVIVIVCVPSSCVGMWAGGLLCDEGWLEGFGVDVWLDDCDDGLLNDWDDGLLWGGDNLAVGQARDENDDYRDEQQ